MKQYIVVGAGILGATTAYKLAKSGTKVLIIDKQGIGQATEAAAGVICPWLSQRRNKAWYHLAKNGARIYPELIKELEEDGITETGYAQVGAISLHQDEGKILAMKERALKRREDAPEIGEITILNPEETRNLVPIIAEGYAAVHISGAGRVDGSLFRNALIRAAEKHGAKFIEGEAILSPTGQAVTVNGETYEADKIIAACGAWMNEFLAPLGIDFQSTGQKGQLIHLQLQNMDSSTWPVMIPPTSQSIVPFENHFVVGATHEDDVGFDHRITAGGVHTILTKAIEVFPELANSTFLGAKVGFRPFTPGYLPVIGELPANEQILVANGLGSSGLTTGPFVGIQLAKLALGKELDISLEDYDILGAIN
ncbi:NAD(P)/FAD-dependent oxidoreductase [Ornithinibacillus halotolerans]|uniref:Oxidoreductase n=1 Tax=Ornithinibacillus halotolerans TaxID=1274357 RepID=A0A916WAP1_9BACI|nr:FAD-dependent oxidoreductase [Ornithinibacillus halotolerans]GGA80692.1 oxidoreductase [Ornithinibacillus halotolerans]